MAEVEAKKSSHRQSKIVVFRLSQQAYAVPLEAVREIVPMAEFAQPPGLPASLAGFLNLGGDAVPVVRLARLFGLPETAAGMYTPLLILREAGFPLALMVDRVLGIVTISENGISPLRDNCTFNDCAEGVTVLDDSLVVLLSPERILLGNERQCLADFQAQEQDRLAAVEVQPA